MVIYSNINRCRVVWVFTPAFSNITDSGHWQTLLHNVIYNATPRGRKSNSQYALWYSILSRHDRPKTLSNTVKVISNIPNISLWYCILSTSVHCICEILDYIFQYLLLLKCVFTELTTRYCNALQVWKCDCYRGIRLIQTFKSYRSYILFLGKGIWNWGT